MSLVTSDDECQPPDRRLVLVGCASTSPGLFFEIREKRNGCAADVFVLVGQIAQAALVEGTATNVVVLLEPFEGRRVSACESQRPISKHPLGVDDVSDDFFDAPLAIRVAKL